MSFSVTKIKLFYWLSIGYTGVNIVVFGAFLPQKSCTEVGPIE